MEPRHSPQQQRETTRRLQLVERKVDRLLDPEKGIYAKLDDVEQRLRGWAIAILTTALGAVVLEVVQFLTRGHG